MSLKDDLQKGRELYRKQSERKKNGNRKRSGANRLLIGIGTLVEQISPLWRKVISAKDNLTTKMQPYKEVMQGDAKCLIDKFVGIFPKKPVKYDPLYEAWKRGR